MLFELLEQSVGRFGRKEAVADARVRLTYSRLLTFARVMRDIIAEGTQKDKVGVLLPASAGFSGCFFGGLWANKIVVPLNFLLSEAELERIVVRAGIDLILTVKHFSELVQGLPARTLYLEDLSLKRRLVTAMLRRTPKSPQGDEDDTAVILFTSGTSGQPKGVELTHRNLVGNAQDCVATACITPDHRFLNCLPPFHVFGLTANVIAPVALGASAFCVPRFSPTAVEQAIRDENISIYMAIPSMYAALLRLKSAPDDLMKSIYLLVSGGEPLPDAVRESFKSRFGMDILQGYGLSETSPVCTLELPWAHKPGSVGKPVRNVEVRIADAEGQPLETEADGEIQVRGPNVMKGYYKDPDATNQVITSDGWFKTGDGGRVDDQGFVTITGRLKDLIIVGGENVYPREIEAVLEAHPAVAEVAVIGAPDTSRGEVPVAFVICREGETATEIELREHARGQLAGYKVPRQVRICEDLPKGPTGKILKRCLRDLL